MLENDYYCDKCGIECNRLHDRLTEPGQYCFECAKIEKCACCGDEVSRDNIKWVEPVRNYLCSYCSYEGNYSDAKDYIKPHFSLRTKSTVLVNA